LDYSSEVKHSTYLYLWSLTSSLEKIADDIKRIVRMLTQLKFKKGEIDKLVEFIILLRDRYLTTMKAYYLKDLKLAYEVALKKRDIMDECNVFLEVFKTKPLMGNITEKLKSIVGHTNDLNRIAYNMHIS
jgi:hypothetical protein